VLLDLDLRDIDGLEVIRRVRAGGSRVPIIVLTDRSKLRAKIEAFETGADDYLAKPFGIEELTARIGAAVPEKKDSEPVFESGALKVDLMRRIVRVKGEEIKLSTKEYEILRLLVVHAGKVLTRSFLVQEVWGPRFPRTIFAHLCAALASEDRSAAQTPLPTSLLRRV
jgi:two-component system, OmpR family, KDP operon response regulator KdpE